MARFRVLGQLTTSSPGNGDGTHRVLEVNDTPWSDQGELNGFHPTNDAAYNVIRDAAKALNPDLRKMN